MSMVWAFIKDGVGKIFSDGITGYYDVDEIFRISTTDTNKTFKVQDQSGNTFIGGIVGYLKVTKFTAPVGPTGSQGTNGNNTGSELTDFKVEMENFLKNHSILDSDENFKRELEAHFNKTSQFNYENHKTYFLIIASWGTLFKVDIMDGKLQVNNVTIKNESIGDYTSYKSRKIFFDGIYNIGSTDFKDFKNMFRLVKRHLCTGSVGGKTFHQSVNIINPTNES